MPPHLGGIELVAESLFAAYRAAGLDARWVAARVPASAAASEEGRIRVACWNGLERKLGVPWPVWGPGGVRALSKLVEWADVLHVHDCLYMGSALAVLIARHAGRPVLLSQHIGFVRYPHAILNGIEWLANYTLGRGVLSHASHIVFCTPAAEEFVSRLLLGRLEAVTTIPNGIDTRRFRPPSDAERQAARRELRLPEGRRIILFVGRLVDKKGVDLVVEVSRQMPSHHFLIVGDGPLKSLIEDGANNLTWLSLVEPEHMEAVYRAADVFLLPSHGEGFPLSVQEAMASCVPAVVAKGEPFTAMLESEGACLAAERDAGRLREAVSELLSKPALAESIAARARRMVERDWSLEAMSARYLELISVLAEQSRAPHTMGER
jgi:glycosyltransferase involved in cell wall biosynthesis